MVQHLQSPSGLDALVFRNFYCSHITIKQRQQLEAEDWSTILLDRPLMEDTHQEDDAQHWHVIATDEFNKNYDADLASPLRYPLLIRSDYFSVSF